MMVRKLLPLALCAALLTALAACGGNSSGPVAHKTPEPQETLTEITLTAGETVLSGVLFDNETARAFAELLPLDAPLWDPAPGYARAFDLPRRITDAPVRTRAYELGSLAYWDEGPSIAIIYNNNREETVVPVTAIGRLDGDVSIFFDYNQPIHIEEVKAEADNPPAAGGGDTVLTALPNPHIRQTLYLWETGNAPAVTEYTVNSGGYFDEPDFRPTITSFPVPEGTSVKGAVLVCAGGAFQFRSDENEGTPVAEALAKLGYQAFVVDYRLRPYTQQEGALDLARAVRFVRKNADLYGIDPEDIAVMGFSAGGILAGEMLLHWDGTVSPAALDSSYLPDGLDAVSADAAADGMIYSFYGRLSVGTTDVELLRSGELPPTFYCYGTEDPFYRQFLANASAAEEAGVTVHRLQLDGMPHGFGSRGDWLEEYDRFLTDVFSEK